MSDLPISRCYGVFQVCADPSSDTKISGILLPQLTTDQVTALIAQSPSYIDNGFVYYDTDLKNIYAYIDGTMKELYTEIAPAGSFILPTGTTSAMEIVANQRAGFLYYNTEHNNVRGFHAGVWTTFSTSTTTATGVGLAAGNSPIVIPTGDHDVVEVAGNAQNMFIYYNNKLNTNTCRAYVNGGWGSISVSSVGSSNGQGFSPGNSVFALPNGSAADVEPLNSADGILYRDTVGGDPRMQIEGAWGTIAVKKFSSLAGQNLEIGSTAFGFPYSINTVENVTANQVRGFTYIYHVTDLLRTYDGTAWQTIPRTGITVANANPYTVLNKDVIIAVDTSTVAHFINLPDASDADTPKGKIFTIKDVAGNANNRIITVSAIGVNPHIDGAISPTIITPYGVMRVYSNGTQWFTV